MIELVVTAASGKQILNPSLPWTSVYEGLFVRETVVLPNGFLILLWDNPLRFEKRLENLIFVDMEGIRRWIAELPDGAGNRYQSVRLENDEIRASDLSTYDVRLDPVNGKIVSKRFTK